MMRRPHCINIFWLLLSNLFFAVIVQVFNLMVSVRTVMSVFKVRVDFNTGGLMVWVQLEERR